MGLVRPCGCGSGEFVLCRASATCRFPCLQVIVLSFRGEMREALTFRGVGEALAESVELTVKTGPGGAGDR